MEGFILVISVAVVWTSYSVFRASSGIAVSFIKMLVLAALIFGSLYFFTYQTSDEKFYGGSRYGDQASGDNKLDGDSKYDNQISGDGTNHNREGRPYRGGGSGMMIFYHSGGRRTVSYSPRHPRGRAGLRGRGSSFRGRSFAGGGK